MRSNVSATILLIAAIMKLSFRLAIALGLLFTCILPAAEPRDWVFIELARNWYVREPNWKLNQAGELFDMTDAPFAEKLVATDTKNAAAIAARQRLQAVLDELNPAGGILDDGDGTGRHANKDKKKAKTK